MSRLLLVAGLLTGCTPTELPSFNDDDDVADDDDAGDDDDDVEPPPAVRSCDIVVAHAPSGSPGSVEIAGEWNAWQPAPMVRGDDGAWTASVGELAPGDYGHKILTDGEWEGPPPKSAYAKWVDGTENRALRVGDCHRPLLTLLNVEASGDSLAATLAFSAAASGTPLDVSSVEATFGEVTADVQWDDGRLVVSADDLAPGKHSLRLTAADDDGVRLENGPMWVPLWVEQERWDWRDALLYFAFTDRFRDGDGDDPLADPIPGVEARANYQGGDFLGLLDAMDDDWFTRLGANVLWLSPVYDNPETPFLAADGFHQFSGFHGYWPVDGRRIENRWGDAGGTGEERLRQVIEEAHRKGIRVLFDLVLNHVHEDHTYVRENPEWFVAGCTCGDPGCGWEERPIDCRFTPYLPDLDYKNHEVLDRVIEDTLTLVRDFDVDALRVDAAKHMDHVVMTTLAKRLRDDHTRGGGADLYLVGETFTGADGRGQLMDYVDADELDGQFDFPLFWTIRESFVHGGSFRNLENAVVAGQVAYGDAVMSPFAGNHDIPRIATEISGNDGGAWGDTDDLMAGGGEQRDLIDRISMALAFTLTQPGAPLLYYGDEIGLAGSGDPDNRRMMTFDPFLSANQSELLERVRAVGAGRAQSKALRRGERVSLFVDDDLMVYVLDAGDDGAAVVALNKGRARSQAISVLGRIPDGTTLTDVTDGTAVAVSAGSLPIDLGPWEYTVLR